VALGPELSERISHFPDGVGKPPSAKGTKGSGTLRLTEPSRSSRSKVIPSMKGWSHRKACRAICSSLSRRQG
jgi:hypothetical protein